MARKCYRQNAGTRLFSLVSSSGGGLPGRPELARVQGARYFCRISSIFETVSALILSHPLGLREDMAFHCSFQFLLFRSFFQVELRVERK